MRRTSGSGAVGTRGGVGRLLAMVLALAAGLCLVAAGAARAGEYTVVECGAGAGSDAEWIADGTGFRREVTCGSAVEGVSFGQPPSAFLGTTVAVPGWVAGGGYAGWRWLFPPGVELRRLAAGDWQELPDGAVVQVGWLDDRGALQPLWETAGANVPSPFEVEAPSGGSGFEARVICARAAAAQCRLEWAALRWRLWNLTLTLEDAVAPGAAIGGDPAAPGWKRGSVAATVSASDTGSGLSLLETRVDGVRAALAEPTCQTVATAGGTAGAALRPCPGVASVAALVPTGAFADGVHELRECATDFSGNEACSPPRSLAIDNGAPRVSLLPRRTGRDPQRVEARASDSTSGVAAGTISYRRAAEREWTELRTRLLPVEGGVELSTQPLELGGRVSFKAEVWDAAGNLGSATGGAEGSPASAAAHPPAAGGEGATRLAAWLGSDRSSSLAVAFGRGVTLHGRLAGGSGGAPGPAGAGAPASGAPGGEAPAAAADRAAIASLGNRRIRVAVRFPRGATARRRTLSTRTGGDGSFALRLPPGPSRILAVSFPGDARLAPARARPLHLRVRAGVSLEAEPSRLRTGDTVILSGRVRRGGATVPRPGKLVTVSYLERASHSWRPVLVTRTDRAGRFRTSYRFRYVTGLARIRLRATAPAEARWPYAPGSSRPLAIEVRGQGRRPGRPARSPRLPAPPPRPASAATG